MNPYATMVLVEVDGTWTGPYPAEAAKVLLRSVGDRSITVEMGQALCAVCGAERVGLDMEHAPGCLLWTALDVQEALWEDEESHLV